MSLSPSTNLCDLQKLKSMVAYSFIMEKQEIYMTYNHDSSTVTLHHGPPPNMDKMLVLDNNNRHKYFDNPPLCSTEYDICMKMELNDDDTFTKDEFTYITTELGLTKKIEKTSNIWFTMNMITDAIDAASHVYHAKKRWQR